MKKLALLIALVMVIGALPVMALGDDYVTMTYFNADGRNASWLENPVGAAITAATVIQVKRNAVPHLDFFIPHPLFILYHHHAQLA